MRLLSVLSVGLCCCVLSSCFNNETEKQQAFLENLLKNKEYAGYEFRTGADGEVVFLSLESVSEQAVPIIALRIFLLTAQEYEQTEYEYFDLQHKGESKVRYKKEDLSPILIQAKSGKASGALLIKITSNALTPDRQLAQVIPPKSGGGLLGAVQSMAEGPKKLVDVWFANSVRARIQKERDGNATKLGSDL